MKSVRNELLELFRYKINRLNDLANSTDRNDLIEVAGLTRDLLMSDMNGLFGEILRQFPELKTKRRHRLRFEILHMGDTTHTMEYPRGKISTDNAEFCSHAQLRGLVSYSRDNLLKIPVLCIRGDHYTFGEVVSFVANKLGARHFDRMTGTEKQMLLHEIRETFGVEDFDPVVTPLIGKAGVVAKTGGYLIERIDSLR